MELTSYLNSYVYDVLLKPAKVEGKMPLTAHYGNLT